MKIPTPTELESKLIIADEAEVQRTIKAIVEKLESCWECNNAVTVSVQPLKPRVRESVMKLFEQKGWKIEYCSDQRDGDYFKVRRGTRYPEPRDPIKPWD